MLKSPLEEIRHMLKAELAPKHVADSQLQHPNLLRFAGEQLGLKFGFRQQQEQQKYFHSVLKIWRDIVL